MKLRDRFKQWLDTQPREQIRDVQLEVIAEEFAIDFTEWCDDNYFRMGNTNLWSDSTDWDDNIKFTTKELLERFKEENKL